MPPLTQRRNAAYLNRPILRFGALDRDPEDQALGPGRDLRLISEARSSRFADLLPSLLHSVRAWSSCAPRQRRDGTRGNLDTEEKICVV